ncbi:hypothetical protein HYY72_00725 [Candidatus Woesearchaeota archaeon]|nr:hypothetical protein [Candidatus Woesearchaeota archaeon]
MFYREEKEKTYEEQTATQKQLVNEALETDISGLLESLK